MTGGVYGVHRGKGYEKVCTTFLYQDVRSGTILHYSLTMLMRCQPLVCGLQLLSTEFSTLFFFFALWSQK